MTHGDEIHATIGFLHRVILFFLSLIPSPQFSLLLRFRQLPLLSSPSSISTLQFIHSVSQSPAKCPFVHRHSREKLVGCKVDEDDDDDDGRSERLSQVYLDGRRHGRAKPGLPARVRKCTHCTDFITFPHFIVSPCDVASPKYVLAVGC